MFWPFKKSKPNKIKELQEKCDSLRINIAYKKAELQEAIELAKNWATYWGFTSVYKENNVSNVRREVNELQADLEQAETLLKREKEQDNE